MELVHSVVHPAGSRDPASGDGARCDERADPAPDRGRHRSRGLARRTPSLPRRPIDPLHGRDRRAREAHGGGRGRPSGSSAEPARGLRGLLAHDPRHRDRRPSRSGPRPRALDRGAAPGRRAADPDLDRKSTRLNSSHSQISYAVFCLKKKKVLLDRKSTRLNSSHSQISYAVFCLKKKHSDVNQMSGRLARYRREHTYIPDVRSRCKALRTTILVSVHLVPHCALMLSCHCDIYADCSLVLPVSCYIDNQVSAYIYILALQYALPLHEHLSPLSPTSIHLFLILRGVHPCPL